MGKSKKKKQTTKTQRVCKVISELILAISALITAIAYLIQVLR